MGQRGPLPKSAFAEARQPSRGVGEPPTHISFAAQGHYMRLAELLKERLEPEDEPLLAICAQSMAEIAEANVKIANESPVSDGPQGPVMSPWVRFRALAHKEMKDAAAKLGLSPADRHRLAGSLNAPPAEAPGGSDFNPDESA